VFPVLWPALYDALSFLWSSWWPTADGEITEVITEQTGDRNNSFRLAVAYKFSVGDDGPCTGECFWKPTLALNQLRTVRNARKRLHVRQRIAIRYRRDDPSVNTLDGGVKRLLRSEK